MIWVLSERSKWDRIIAINLRGVFLCMKHEIPLMLHHGGGAIVNTFSGTGVIGFARRAAYAAAKHGVVGFSNATALDYAQSNIRVNAVWAGITADGVRPGVSALDGV